MPRTSTTARKAPPPRDMSIVGDLIRYFLLFFIPFSLLGVIYGLIHDCYLMCFLVNPFIYAGGFALIIVIIRHDINDILALFGQARDRRLAQHIKHGSTIQLISVQMGSLDYNGALKTVNRLLAEEPDYPNALNLKGQILLEGFGDFEQARTCFDRVIELTRPDSDDYMLADSLKMAAHDMEEDHIT